jgi:hypothetical protein
VLSFSNGSSENTASQTQAKPNGRRIR